MGSGVSGTGMRRAADALLQALGKDTIALLLPATATAGDAAGLLGLVDPGVQQVVISPVLVTELPTTNLGPRRKIQFTISASMIAGELSSLGMATAEDLFNAALGISYCGSLFHVETFVPDSYAGTVCFWIVTAVE
jgi:hypothetical protein